MRYWTLMPANKQNKSWSLTFFEPIQSCLYWFLITVNKHSNQITGVNPTHESCFTDLVLEFSTLGIPHLTQQKFLEQFDSTVLTNLLEVQTSNRDTTRLLSFFLHQSGAWLTQQLSLLLAYIFNLRSSKLL